MNHLSRSMVDVLRVHAEQRPSQNAVVTESGAMTYAEFDQRSDALAAGLIELGVKPRDPVAVILPNDRDLLCVWLACGKSGAIFLPINPALKTPEVSVVARSAEPAAVVTATDGEVLSAFDPERTKLVYAGQAAASGGTTLADLEAASGELPKTSPEDWVSLLYTSGSTGEPKGVIHDHRFWNAYAVTGYAEPFDFGPETRYLNVMPLFHINGLGFTWSVIYAGGTLIQLQKFSASGYWDSVREHRANCSFIISAMANMLLARDPSPTDREHDIRLLGTSALVPDKTVELEERFGVTLLSSYGMTEGGGCVEWPNRRRLGSGGVPASHIEIRVVDDDGNPCPPGMPGRVQMRDKGAGLAVGYWGGRGELSAPIRDAGWFDTSDFARIDEDGFLFFVARVRDRLRRAGENISAVEVEDTIKSHPDIVEAAVVGVPDPIVDEELMAYVQLREGAEPDIDSYLEYVTGRLAPFKCPRYWKFVDSFPRTPTERVKKHVLSTDPAAIGALDVRKDREK